jgi:hypothetical protein
MSQLQNVPTKNVPATKQTKPAKLQNVPNAKRPKYKTSQASEHPNYKISQVQNVTSLKTSQANKKNFFNLLLCTHSRCGRIFKTQKSSKIRRTLFGKLIKKKPGFISKKRSLEQGGFCTQRSWIWWSSEDGKWEGQIRHNVPAGVRVICEWGEEHRVT